MAAKDMDRPLSVKDSVIDVNENLEFNDLWEGALQTNASLLQADQNTVLAQLDYKKVLSRNYPYVRLNAGYGYTLNKYDVNATRQRSNWGSAEASLSDSISSTVTGNGKNEMPAWPSAMHNLPAMNWNKAYGPT